MLTAWLTLASQLAVPSDAPTAEIEVDAEVVSFRWNDRPPVPMRLGPGPIAIPLGMAGRDPTSVLYLPEPAAGTGEERPDAAGPPEGGAAGVDEDAGAAATAPRPAPIGVTPGRFGDGWAVPEGRYLELGEGDAPLADGDWTVAYWLEPAAGSDGGPVRMLEDRPIWRVFRDPEDRLNLVVEEDGLGVRSVGELVPGAWNHVAVVFQATPPAAVRLVLNGRGVGRRRAPDEAMRALRGLRVGGIGGRMDALQVFGRALSSGELAELANAAPPPGEQRLVLTLADGATREERVWHGVVDGPELAGEGFRAAERDHARVDARGARWVPGQWTRDVVTVRPSPRTTHAHAFLGDHRVLIFGGEVTDSQSGPFLNTDDTWIYDAAERRWTRSASPVAPSPRCHVPAAYSPDHDLVLLVGGWRNDERGEELHDDTWVYRVAEDRWERREPAGVDLPPTANHALVYHAPTKLFLLERNGRLFVYDPERDAWMEPEVARPDPALADQRHRALSRTPLADPASGRVYYYAGEWMSDDEHLFTDAMTRFDPSVPALSPVDADTPPARVRAAHAYDSRRERFVVFGGVRDQHGRRFDDLWTFDSATETWEEREAADVPSPRGGYYGMAYDPALDVFVLPLGRHDHQRFLDDVWRLELADDAPGRLRAVFDRAAHPDRDHLGGAWSVPDGAELAWTFAASDDLWRWTAEAADPATLPAHRYLRVTAHLRPNGDAEGPSIERLGLATEGGWTLPPRNR